MTIRYRDNLRPRVGTKVLVSPAVELIDGVFKTIDIGLKFKNTPATVISLNEYNLTNDMTMTKMPHLSAIKCRYGAFLVSPQYLIKQELKIPKKKKKGELDVLVNRIEQRIKELRN